MCGSNDAYKAKQKFVSEMLDTVIQQTAH
jgi:hypothetical protein